MKSIRILIVDDNQEIREYLKRIIDNEADMQVAGLAVSGMDAYNQTIKLRPELVLMDIQMESKTAGIEAIKKIREFDQSIKTIVLTIHERDDYLLQAYAAGAADYIIKTNSIENILQSIRAVISNTLLLRPEIANKIVQEYYRVVDEMDKKKEIYKIMMSVTNTEYEIIRLLCRGYSYESIAMHRYVEPTTIRTEVHRILKKFNKRKMKDVIALIKEANFFDQNDLTDL